jgi:DNA-binding NtrC family response regulator
MSDASLKTRVLIIDDEKGMRDMLSFTLTKKNFDVTVMESGEKGVAAAIGSDFDVVVCDIMMPGLDGIKFLEILKRERPAVEVIIVTGYPHPDRYARAKELGAFEFLSKPYAMATLCPMLEAAAARKRARASSQS